MNPLDRIEGAVIGFLVGDALGVPHEWCEEAEIPEAPQMTGGGAWEKPAGTYSDDGSLLLCQMASLISPGGGGDRDLADRLLAWRSSGYLACDGETFGIGGGVEEALCRIERGVPPAEAGPDSERDNGSGSLVRLMAYGLWEASAPGAIVAAYRSSGVTHGHWISRVTAAWGAGLISNLVKGLDPTAACERTRSQIIASRLAVPEHVLRTDPEGPFSPSGYTVDVLRSAWSCATRWPRFELALHRAVQIGGDADSRAAVTGAFAGALHGVSNIPPAWISTLRTSSEVKTIISDFCEAAYRRQNP